MRSSVKRIVGPEMPIAPTSPKPFHTGAAMHRLPRNMFFVVDGVSAHTNASKFLFQFDGIRNRTTISITSCSAGCTYPLISVTPEESCSGLGQ